MQLQEPSDCANCGAVLAGDARFCQRCGAPVSRSADDEGVPAAGERSAPERTPLDWAILAGAALLVLLAVAAVGFALLVLVFGAFVE